MIGNNKTSNKTLTPMLIAAAVFSTLVSGCASATEDASVESQAVKADDTRHVSGRLIAYTTPVGASEVNAGAIKPYAARWTTPRGGVFEETLEAVDGATWKHTQILSRTTDGDAVKVATETRTLSRDDLRSLSWARTHHIGSPNLPFKDVATEVRADGLFGEMTTLEGEKAPFNSPLPMPVFDGWIAGIAIAALPLKEGYWASLPTATYIFKGVHHITLRVVGRETLKTPQGEDIDTWKVEAEWVDLGSGDIYEPGAEGTGGVYHMAVEPGGGVPYVVKYEAQSNPIMWDGVRLPTP